MSDIVCEGDKHRYNPPVQVTKKSPMIVATCVCGAFAITFNDPKQTSQVTMAGAAYMVRGLNGEVVSKSYGHTDTTVEQTP